MATLLLVDVGIQVTTVVAAGKVGDEGSVVVEMVHPHDVILSVTEIAQDTEE